MKEFNGVIYFKYIWSTWSLFKTSTRRKISEKNVKEKVAAAERNDQRMMPLIQCMFIWPCYHQGDVVCLYLSILRCICQQSSRDGPGGSPVTKAPSPSFTTTLWEGQPPQQKYHPPQLHPFDPKPSHIWDNMHTVHSTNPLLPTICLPSTQN